jgi:3-dehydroquinate dehydratase
LEKLHQAELQLKVASKAMKEARIESLQLKERLLDKKNELQSITQKNDELRTCQSKAEEKIVELSSQLKEVVTVEKVREMPEKANSVLDVEIEKPKVEEKSLFIGAKRNNQIIMSNKKERMEM